MKRKTIREALKGASFCLYQSGLEHSPEEAEILLAHLMRTDRLQLFLMAEQEISADIEGAFQKALQRRAGGEPLAYITGEKYFYGRRFMVNKNVLIPRPETELLVERALRWAEQSGKKKGEPIKTVDLGTGSGILAITLTLLLNLESVWAIDNLQPALENASLNARLHQVEDCISFVQGNYFEALDKIDPKPLFNLVIANPPYIKTNRLSSLPKEVKNYEPSEALNGGAEGLNGFRAILEKLPLYVDAPALLLLEIGADQQDAVESLCRQTALFDTISCFYDLGGHPRVIQAEIT